MTFFDPMSDQGDRLRRARIAAGYESATDAAKAFGWNPSTYSSHENGQTEHIPDKKAARYARAFNVSIEWLKFGKGPMRPGGKDEWLDLFAAIPDEDKPQALDYLRFLSTRRR